MIPLGILSQSRLVNVSQGAPVTVFSSISTAYGVNNLTAGFRRSEDPYTYAATTATYPEEDGEGGVYWNPIGFRITLSSPKTISRINLFTGYGVINSINGIGSTGEPNSQTWSSQGPPAGDFTIVFKNSSNGILRTITNPNAIYLFSQLDFVAINDVKTVEFSGLTGGAVYKSIVWAGIELWGN